MKTMIIRIEKRKENEEDVLELKKTPRIKKSAGHLVDYLIFNSTDDTHIIATLSACRLISDVLRTCAIRDKS